MRLNGYILIAAVFLTGVWACAAPPTVRISGETASPEPGAPVSPARASTPAQPLFSPVPSEAPARTAMVPVPTTGPQPLPTSLSPLGTPPRFIKLPNNSFLPEVARISIEEVKAKMESGVKIVVLDSRAEQAYEQSHILGALSMPYELFKEPFAGLDRNNEIIIYCTWEDEQNSASSAKKLMDAGFVNVKVIDGGLSAWEKAGFPVAKKGSGGG